MISVAYTLKIEFIINKYIYIYILIFIFTGYI